MKLVVICLISILLSNCGTELKCNPEQLKVGMNKQEIIKLCGKPDHINYSGPYGGNINEQWVYSYGFPRIGGSYLYIEGGRFTSMQWKN